MAHLSSDPAVLQTLNPNFVGWEQTIPFGSKYLSKSRKTWWSSSMFFKKLRSKVFLRCSPGHWVTLWGTKSTVTGYDKASKRSKHLRRQDASSLASPWLDFIPWDIAVKTSFQHDFLKARWQLYDWFTWNKPVQALLGTSEHQISLKHLGLNDTWQSGTARANMWTNMYALVIYWRLLVLFVSP